jgi:hypothetical protein
MSTIFHIIKDEQERLSAYTAATNKELQGAPQVKHVGNKDYLYIAQRSGDAVKFWYKLVEWVAGFAGSLEKTNVLCNNNNT